MTDQTQTTVARAYRVAFIAACVCVAVNIWVVVSGDLWNVDRLFHSWKVPAMIVCSGVWVWTLRRVERAENQLDA